MPIIQVNLLQGRSAEAKRKLASEMTRVTCECLETAPEQVRIMFNDMPPENYSIAGTLAADKKNSGSDPLRAPSMSGGLFGDFG